MRYYVYRLKDPRNGETFYIGKGSGNRIDQHEQAVRSGYERNGEKRSHIREIWNAGLEVDKEIVARFEYERDAYAFECHLIRSEKPKTNATSGGFHDRGWTLFGLLNDVLLRKVDRRKELNQYFPKHRLSNPDHIKLHGIIEKGSERIVWRQKQAVPASKIEINRDGAGY